MKRLSWLVLSAGLLALAGAGAFVGCNSTSTVTTAAISTDVFVDPGSFLGDAVCGDSLQPGAVRSYVLTAVDLLQPDGGTTFVLPSTPPTPCHLKAAVGDVVPGHYYIGYVDVYDLPPCAAASTDGCIYPLGDGTRTMVTGPAASPLVVLPTKGGSDLRCPPRTTLPGAGGGGTGGSTGAAGGPDGGAAGAAAGSAGSADGICGGSLDPNLCPDGGVDPGAPVLSIYQAEVRLNSCDTVHRSPSQGTILVDKKPLCDSFSMLVPGPATDAGASGGAASGGAAGATGGSAGAGGAPIARRVGPVDRLQIRPVDGSRPPVTVSCGDTSQAIFSGYSPGREQTFQVFAYAADASSPRWGAACTAVPISGVRVNASCQPLATTGGLIVAASGRCSSASAADASPPPGQDGGDDGGPDGGSDATLTRVELLGTGRSSSELGCTDDATFRNLAPGIYTARMRVTRASDGSAVTAGTCQGEVLPGQLDRISCAPLP